MSKTILITGAGSGFGEGRRHRAGQERPRCHRHRADLAAGRARCGEKAAELGLTNLRVEKLDLIDRL